MIRHWSDCALHGLPAYFPMRCTCAARVCPINNLLARGIYAVVWFCVTEWQVWSMRLQWKEETGSTWGDLLREIVKHFGKDRWHYYSRARPRSKTR